VPTLRELGYDVEYYVWSGVFVPAATPQPVIATLRDAIRRSVSSAEFKTAMDNMKSPIPYLDAPQFREFLAKDAARLRRAVQKIGKVE
jgi:tripartite-type tricarboxylate transporter receptor subunit TctC